VVIHEDHLSRPNSVRLSADESGREYPRPRRRLIAEGHNSNSTPTGHKLDNSTRQVKRGELHPLD